MDIRTEIKDFSIAEASQKLKYAELDPSAQCAMAALYCGLDPF